MTVFLSSVSQEEQQYYINSSQPGGGGGATPSFDWEIISTLLTENTALLRALISANSQLERLVSNTHAIEYLWQVAHIFAVN